MVVVLRTLLGSCSSSTSRSRPIVWPPPHHRTEILLLLWRSTASSSRRISFRLDYLPFLPVFCFLFCFWIWFFRFFFAFPFWCSTAVSAKLRRKEVVFWSVVGNQDGGAAMWSVKKGQSGESNPIGGRVM
jgi:hypothetical protein